MPVPLWDQSLTKETFDYETMVSVPNIRENYIFVDFRTPTVGEAFIQGPDAHCYVDTVYAPAYGQSLGENKYPIVEAKIAFGPPSAHTVSYGEQWLGAIYWAGNAHLHIATIRQVKKLHTDLTRFLIADGKHPDA